MHTDDKDGACHVVREFNDIVVVITVFALLIWYFHYSNKKVVFAWLLSNMVL